MESPGSPYILDSKCGVSHPMYTPQERVGSTKNLKLRWANHKLDVKLKRVNKCSVAHHVHAMDHSNDITFSYLQIFAIEAVSDETCLLRRETWWQCNLGTIFKGLNVRKDI